MKEKFKKIFADSAGLFRFQSRPIGFKMTKKEEISYLRQTDTRVYKSIDGLSLRIILA